MQMISQRHKLRGASPRSLVIRRPNQKDSTNKLIETHKGGRQTNKKKQNEWIQSIREDSSRLSHAI